MDKLNKKEFERIISEIPFNYVPTETELNHLLSRSPGFILSCCQQCGDLILLNEEGLCSKCRNK